MVTVEVRERAPIITVMFKAADTAGIKLTANSGIFEISETLRIREYKQLNMQKGDYIPG